MYVCFSWLDRLVFAFVVAECEFAYRGADRNYRARRAGSLLPLRFAQFAVWAFKGSVYFSLEILELFCSRRIRDEITLGKSNRAELHREQRERTAVAK